MGGVKAGTGARERVRDAALVGVVAVVLLVPVLRLWDADLGVPFTYLGPHRGTAVYAPDAPFYLMEVKGIIDHGWFWTNPSLGAPFHQALFDLPQTLDNLNLGVLKGLGLIFGSVAVTVNVFWILTFAGVAVAAFLVMRALGVSRSVAAVMALLYAYLPYHFTRGTGHLLLSAYWVVPLGVYLLMRIVSDRPPFTVADDSERGWRVRLVDGSAFLWFLACIVLASSGSYFAAFTLLFVASLTAIDFLARRRRRVLASGVIMLLAVGGMTIVNLTPIVAYWAVHGQAPALDRGPPETEIQGLKLSQLLLPVEQHRIDALAEIQADSTRFSPLKAGESGQQLGAIGAAGFVGLLGASLVLLRRRERSRAPDDDTDHPPLQAPARSHSDVIRTAGVLAFVAIVVAVPSAFSLLLSGVGIHYLRSWNRILVFLAFFAFLTVGYGIDWLVARLPERRWRGPFVAVGLLVVLAVGVLDQVSPAVTPDYATNASRWDSDAAFVSRIDRNLPPNAMVFQLPYLFFPESGSIGALGPYDLARGYIHSQDLRWSWGGVRGREADWQAAAVQRPVPEMLDRVAAVGFDGLMLDNGIGAAQDRTRELVVSKTLGQQPIVSRYGDLSFFDLRPYRRALRARLGDDGVRRLRKETLADRSGDPSRFS